MYLTNKNLNIKYAEHTQKENDMIKESNITFRVTTEQKKQLERIAKEDDRKISYLMQKIIQGFLEGHKEVQ